MQRVLIVQGEMQAQQVRGFLESAGIMTIAKGEALRTIYGLTADGLAAVEIIVDDADADRARELLASADKGELRIE